MNKTLNTLKGFRDFLPEEKRKRDWVQKKIVETFELFGFEPMETPTLEYAALLQGKYGDDADKLLYTFTDKGSREVGLRYDQTVPTARVLGQYQNELPKYFRRYQIQNVFRADKPQKGRYREFVQCDCDIFGSKDLTSDVEILSVFFQAYKSIGLESIQIKINDRKIINDVRDNSKSLFGVPFIDNEEDTLIKFIIDGIDNLDKKNDDEIISDIYKKSYQLFEEPYKEKILADIYYEFKSKLNNQQPNTYLSNLKLAAVANGIPAEKLVFSPTLIRGLDYYTGLIFEAILPDNNGSLGGGGRYDNLLETLTGTSSPAIGFGIGFDRTVEAADQLGLIPPTQSTAQVLVTVFEAQYLSNSLVVAAELRQSGIKTEIYPAIDKLAKQFKLANQKQIPYVIVIGQEEMAQNQVTLKNMQTGQQQKLELAEVVNQLQQ